ncbi:MAG: murein biosynthesis integral membrane protein MurJ [Thermodesulfovibrionales bacterium]|nr:murein biosynthesis integral membrane protein MurJ [Thermodesulfovibrionales bacterium]
MTTKSKIAKAAVSMSFATLISRIFGYIKDMILAKYFGATATSDVFFVAFRIPNLLRDLFAEGSMSSAFIPVLTETLTKNGKDDANKLVRTIFMISLFIVGSVCILGIVFAPIIVSAIAPGFISNPEKFEQTVLLTRIMFPFLLFISFASITMGALNTRGVFFVPALAPAFLNISIILCLFLFSQKFTNPIVAVAIGVSVGGFVQFLFQIPSFKQKGYSFFGTNLNLTSFWHPSIKKIGILIIPSITGLAVVQVNIFISTILASFLHEGSITYLYYSMRLIQFPIGLFGVAMGMAVLPTLSEHAARKNFDNLKEDFSFALRLLFFITIPAMIGLICLKEPIVNTLFQRGEFGYQATIGTSEALMFYSLGIWAIVGVRVLASTFYSMQDTKIPVKIAIFSMIVNILFSLLLMKPMQHNGLALANALASITNFILLFYLLRKKIGSFGAKRIVKSFIKTLLAAVIMGLSGWLIIEGDLWKTEGNFLIKSLYLVITIIISIMIFLFISYLLRNDELKFIVNKFITKRRGINVD